MAAKTTTKTTEDMDISRFSFREEHRSYLLLGASPLIFNAMSAKVKQGLLLPTGRKTAAEKATSLKHDPFQEFRDSVYRMAEGPTLLGFPGSAIRSAIGDAAVDVPGAKRTEIARLTWVMEHTLPIYGVPKLRMDVVRSADMARTPDIRSRATIEHWCTIVTIGFDQSLLKPVVIDQLMARAGRTIGLGDYRQQKGAGSYGMWVVEDGAHEMAKFLLEYGGREAQIAAMEAAEPWDAEAEELLAFWKAEVVRRAGSALRAVKPTEEQQEAA